ncbi:hypothetical protein [Bacterioplanoides sp.]|uniref:hypothetical protein n=1 Tax=Bacterioplanoides sp. TaxID=2066072 RepID=UPI003B5C347C
MKECVSILSREFWLKGEKQTPCCCVFIGFNDGSWEKALYNDESYTWELNSSDEIPNENHPLGDDEFSYPYKQYLPAELETAGTLSERQLVTNNELVVVFSSGLKLILSYNANTESEYIEINT